MLRKMAIVCLAIVFFLCCSGCMPFQMINSINGLYEALDEIHGDADEHYYENLRPGDDIVPFIPDFGNDDPYYPDDFFEDDIPDFWDDGDSPYPDFMPRLEIPFEVQLATLDTLEIAPKAALRQEFLAWIEKEWGLEYIESYPYTALLEAIGDEMQLAGQWVDVSDDVWSFDMECVSDETIYIQALQNLNRISDGEALFSDVICRFDYENNICILSFVLAGNTHTIELMLQGDWFDGYLFDGINEILEIYRYPGRFYSTYSEQNIILLWADDVRIRAIEEQTGLDFFA